MAVSKLNNALVQISKRAESYDKNALLSTFVDVGPLFTLLSTTDHQVLYGRRGTGKTHALSYLAGSKEAKGEIAVHIDMRTIGSTGGVYADSTTSISDRATRLIIDTLNEIHNSILSTVLKGSDRYDLSVIHPRLEDLSKSISQVEIVGSVEHETSHSAKEEQTEETSIGINLGYNKIGADSSFSQRETHEQTKQDRIRREGHLARKIHFGSLSYALKSLLETLNNRVWILIDEWSEIPTDLQPILADLLRKTLMSQGSITIKIAAIEHRSNFRIVTPSEYMGIEVGADVSTNLNLDEFMVFDNDADLSKEFFSELLFKHVYSIVDREELNLRIKDSQDFIKQAFTQDNVFDELVRAAEGVPRDAIHILSNAALKAMGDKISKQNIRVAAKNWYNSGKEAAIKGNVKVNELLEWIIEEVIAHRRARAFLIRNDVRNDLIDLLFDARILHVVKQGISSHDQPGIRYNVYAIDYGCYVDLITTSKAPRGLFEVENNRGEVEFIEVPVNDYRSIRRSILDVEEFEKRSYSQSKQLNLFE